ncbi:hypothetical protein A7U60_g3329 [Sanghuangporus baumii]|uniref:ABM domain-containing protein n=1 Tax=Sanghuangporus baumii TaxID=108892 RepID=A0A9Q5I101_SANBA|nr:hypothetical protein A7U60_g3329 [Sanghuangporus baumii]
MASNPQDIKGPLVIAGRVGCDTLLLIMPRTDIFNFVKFEAQPGKADELAQWLANLKARADSDKEPGTVQYNIVRFGESFAIFEEYTGLEALVAYVLPSI